MGKRVTNATSGAIAAIEAAATGLKSSMPAEFPRLLFGRSVAEDLEALPPEMLARTAAAAFEHLAQPRKPDTINLRFRDEAAAAGCTIPIVPVPQHRSSTTGRWVFAALGSIADECPICVVSFLLSSTGDSVSSTTASLFFSA